MTVAFASWAAIVAWGVGMVTTQISEIADAQDRQGKEFAVYIAATERRITENEAWRRHHEKEIDQGKCCNDAQSKN